MKKVLVITYYWPPAGGSGVQRWVKFVKYLRSYGWEPVVYTPSNPEFPEIDESLLKDIPANLEIIKQPIWEPYNIYKTLTGKKKTHKIGAGFATEKGKMGLADKISTWIRGNLLIPDPRLFWIKPSVKFLLHYLKEHKVDVIVSSGPPHSMHLIARGVRRKLDIPWVADFRDPWTQIDFYKDLMLSGWANKKHHCMERTVLEECDQVLVVGNTMKEEFQQMGINPEKIKVITNGFDDDDLPKTGVEPDTVLSLVHIGTLNKSRNPDALWAALKELTQENPEFAKDFKLRLIGKTDGAVLERITHFNLDPFTEKISYIPHEKVSEEQLKSQVLLLILNNTQNAKGIVTGKFFEYLAAKRPILTLGDKEGDVAKILNDTKAGKVVDFYDRDTIKTEMLKFYDAFKNGTLANAPENIDKYSRKNLTGQLTKNFDALIRNFV